MLGLINNKLFLPQYVKMVEGRKNACIINIIKGEYTLINLSAYRLLCKFEGGNSLDGIYHNISLQNKVLPFINSAIKHGLLIDNGNGFFNKEEPIWQNDSKINSTALSLTIELSSKCNLHCLHCYNDSGNKEFSVLSSETIIRILNETKANFSKLSIITLTGGEPFLYKDIGKIVECAANIGFNKVRINSNGTVTPSKKLLNIFSRYHNIEIQFTLLGIDSETHDLISTVDGSFEKTISTIKLVLNTNVIVTCVLMKTTNFDVKKIEELENILGIKIALSDIYPIGRAKSNLNILQTNILNNSIPKRSPKINFIQLSEEKSESLLASFPPQLPCGKNTFSISSKGDLHPCTLLQNNKIGNIYDQSIISIMNSKKMLRFRDKISIENREICKGCELKYVCENKCPAVSEYFGGNVGIKNPFCKYY